jgi:hypothetical protein
MSVRVHYDGYVGARAVLNGTAARVAATPLDVARAVALTCGPAPALDPLRRLMRLGAHVLEVLAHLDRDGAGALRVVGLDGLEPTARSELSQRLGVGFARIAAEVTPQVGLVDLYALDALSRSDAAPKVVQRGAKGRRPDFVGSDAAGAWSVLEAKGRSAKGSLPGTRLRAHAQAQAVDFQDLLGRLIPLDMRLGSVARLGHAGIDIWLEDPEPTGARRVYSADPDEMLRAYYQPARDLIAVYGPRLRGVSGATGFGSAPLPGTNISLAIHSRLGGVLEEPDVLRAVRAEMQADFLEDRRDAVEAEDLDLSVGLDGLALVADSQPVDMVSWFDELRDR